MNNYQKELIQVAAVALAMAQVDRFGSTDIATMKGEDAMFDLGVEATEERRRQENKWGVRTAEGTTREWWLAVLMEEVGEVAKEILESKCST